MNRFLMVVSTVLALGLSTAARAQTPSAAPAELNYKAHKKLGFKLSCQAWTFREMSAFETLDTIHNLGIRYIEFFPGQRFSKEKPDAKLDHNMSPELVKELKAKLKSVNVTPMNYGVVGFGKDEASARKVFDWARTMEIKTIVSEPAEEMVPLLEKLADEYKINVAIHDHPKPSHYWHPDTVLKVSEGRSKRVGACCDTGHWFRSGLVPVDCIKKLEGRVISLHFKDLGEARHDVPWGTGLCNARGILEELRRQGVKPVISVEYEHGSGAPLLENVRKCVAWFDATVTEMAKQKK